MTPPSPSTQNGQSGQNTPAETNTTVPGGIFTPPAAQPVSTNTVPAEMQQPQETTSFAPSSPTPQNSIGTPTSAPTPEPVASIDAQIQQPTPTPTMPGSPIAQGTTAQPPEVQKKRFPLLKVFILIVALLSLITIIASVIFLSGFLKENYVPGVSGYTEKLLLSEGEQFALRNESLYKGLIYSSLTTEDSAFAFKSNIDPSTIKPFMGDRISEELNNIKSLDYESAFTTEYRLNKPIKETYQSLMFGNLDNQNFVLGTVDPGEINEQTINDILDSSTGKIYINSKSSIDITDNTNQKSQTTTELVFDANSVNLNTQFELKFLEDNLYFYLDRFPRNEYFKPELITGKWMYTDGGDVSNATVGLLPYNPIVLTDSEPEFNQKEYDVVVNLLNSDAVKNTITSSYDERVGEYDARCYVMSLTAQNLDNIYMEFARLYDIEYQQSASELFNKDDINLEKFELHLCYSKSTNIPVRVHVPLVVNVKDIGTIELVSDLKILAINSSTLISAPADSTNFEDLDWSEILVYPTTPPVPTSRATSSPTITGFYNKNNICNLLPDSATCTSCTNNSSDCESCLYYLNNEAFIENASVQSLCIDGIN